MRRLIALVPLVVLAALAILFFGYGLNRKSEVTTRGLVGKPMPTMTLPRLEDGVPADLAQTIQAIATGPDGARQPVLVNFYASWCAPCIIENPELMKLKAQGVKIVGVSFKDLPADSQTFLARQGDPFVAHLVDQTNQLGLQFGVTGPPETYLVDAQGVIRDKHISVLTVDDAMAMLAKVRS